MIVAGTAPSPGRSARPEAPGFLPRKSATFSATSAARDRIGALAVSGRELSEAPDLIFERARVSFAISSERVRERNLTEASLSVRPERRVRLQERGSEPVRSR